MIYKNDMPEAGYEALGVAIVSQAVRDWKALCRSGITDNRSAVFGQETFDRLRYFFKQDCFGYLITEGAGYSILRQLEDYRIYCDRTKRSSCKS